MEGSPRTDPFVAKGQEAQYLDRSRGRVNQSFATVSGPQFPDTLWLLAMEEIHQPG
jgi:hypothetical protein